MKLPPKPMDQPKHLQPAFYIYSALPALALPPPIPANQSDLILLGGVGIAIMLIIILLLVILILLFIIRRRSKQPRSEEIDQRDLPTQVTVKNDLTAPPTIDTPVEEMATIPSPPVKEAKADDTEPSLKGVKEPDTMPISGQRPPDISWEIAGLTDVGRKRHLNEDNMVMIEVRRPDMGPCGLYVVADGMGGHEGGEVASQLTVDTIQAHFDQTPPAPENVPFEEWLKGAIMAANEIVIAHQKDNTQPKKMGATLVMAFVANGQAHIANVGDSRAYRLTDNGIQQITTDHSLVERLIEIGQITREEARNHKQRNVVYSTIGDKATLQIGFHHLDLQPGNRLLLCSDGLSGMLTDEQIFNINRDHRSPAEVCKILVRAANAAGGDDNITVIIIEMGRNH